MRIVDEDSSLFINCDTVSDDDKHAYKETSNGSLPKVYITPDKVSFCWRSALY